MIKLCKDCKFEEVKALSPDRPYRCCKKTGDQKNIAICLNERSENGACGPDGRLWDAK